jgi:uncharacterized membrane protein (UPF0127 family)
MADLPEGRIFSLGNKQFNFSVATEAIELVTGLGGVVNLSPFDGMLFDFGINWPVAMTPKGLTFPVEVAFISDEGVIKEIKTLNPRGHNTYSFVVESSEEVRFALEVPVDFFEENGIVVGDVLRF